MTTSNKELVLTRVFDAPREMVFKAWVESKRLAQWWGPHHYHNPVCQIDAKPGGAILIHMEGPSGNHPMTGVVKEMVPNEKLVFTAVVADPKGKILVENLNTVTFEAQGSKTKLTLHVKVLQAADEAAPMLAGMKEGWSQSLEKLANLVRQA